SHVLRKSVFSSLVHPSPPTHLYTLSLHDALPISFAFLRGSFPSHKSRPPIRPCSCRRRNRPGCGAPQTISGRRYVPGPWHSRIPGLSRLWDDDAAAFLLRPGGDSWALVWRGGSSG